MNVAGVGAGLGGDVCDAVAADYVAAEEVARGEAKDYLRPAVHVETSKSKLKWEVPNNSTISLWRFIRMLTHTLLIPLQKNNSTNKS